MRAKWVLSVVFAVGLSSGVWAGDESKASEKAPDVQTIIGKANLAAYYQTPFIVAPLTWKPKAPTETITLAGNINEAIDILAADSHLPAVEEGDYLALFNAGGYGSASSSNHCMRGTFSEYLLMDGLGR